MLAWLSGVRVGAKRALNLAAIGLLSFASAPKTVSERTGTFSWACATARGDRAQEVRGTQFTNVQIVEESLGDHQGLFCANETEDH